MKRWLAICLLALTLCVGCKVVTDPATGEKNYSLDQKVSDKAEQGAEVGIALDPLLGPVGIPIATALAGALAAWRKVKPQLTEAKTSSEEYHAVASATVQALESFKETNPEQWKQLGDLISAQMQKQNLDPVAVENVIRALRGLPPKA
jgi:hypothetical protein